MTFREPEPAERHRAEAEFHDAWADSEVPTQVAVRATFEAPTAPENRFILRLLGDVRGKRILDVGTGLGEAGAYFAMRGADVTVTDLSPGMAKFARRLAVEHGATVQAVVSPAEQLPFRDETFDIVYVANTLHHVTDKGSLLSEIRRVLKCGGRFVSIDPLAYNPVINVYRRMATKVRTPDEAPLTFDDVDAVRSVFPDVRHREFWIAGLALFLKFYLLDRVHPNQDRYWKRILREGGIGLLWWHPLRLLDGILTRLPLIRRLAWNMVMWGSRGSDRRVAGAREMEYPSRAGNAAAPAAEPAPSAVSRR